MIDIFIVVVKLSTTSPITLPIASGSVVTILMARFEIKRLVVTMKVGVKKQVRKKKLVNVAFEGDVCE